MRVPAAGVQQPVAPDEHRVAAQGDEPHAAVVVEPALEPEVVLEDVAYREPARVIVHELRRPLHDLHGVLLEGMVDGQQHLGSDLVLGIEDADDLTATVAEGRVEGSRLVLVLVAVDDHPEAPVARGGARGDLMRLGVVVAHHHDHLERGMAKVGDAGDGLGQHLLLVTGRMSEKECRGGRVTAEKTISWRDLSRRHA
jgi:hypothetical protein